MVWWLVVWCVISVWLCCLWLLSERWFGFVWCCCISAVGLVCGVVVWIASFVALSVVYGLLFWGLVVWIGGSRSWFWVLV